MAECDCESLVEQVNALAREFAASAAREVERVDAMAREFAAQAAQVHGAWEQAAGETLAELRRKWALSEHP